MLKFMNNGEIREIKTEYANYGVIFTMNPDSPEEDEARRRFYGTQYDEDKRFREHFKLK